MLWEYAAEVYPFWLYCSSSEGGSARALIEQIQKEARPFSSELPFAKSALALFILCTCIETLGRSKEHVFYNNWLEDRKTRLEVTYSIEKHEGEDKLSFLKSIHREYLDIYGFTRSFNGFFNNHLNKEWQDRLASSVTTIVNKPPNFEPEPKGDPLDDLVKYLLDFRNKFAHNMELSYEIPLEKELPEEWIELYSKADFFTYQKIYDDGSYETILTRDLINSLLQSIRFVLQKWIQEEAERAPCRARAP